MRQGFFPGQLDTLRDLARKGLQAEARERRLQRRSLLLGSLGFALGGVGGAAAGSMRSMQTEPETGSSPWDDLALGPIDGLADRAIDFLAEIEQGRVTPNMWLGYERLLLYGHALAARASLARRVRATAAVVTPPPAIASTLRELDNGGK